jgi:hypothetical protein
MPTNWKRVNVTRDPELSDALQSVAPYFKGAPAARVVHDLAVIGAQAIIREYGERDAAVERLVALSTERQAAIDWDVLARVDELAWSE